MRDFAALREMQGELMRLRQEVVALGAAEAHMDGAYDKMFCKLNDPAFPLRLLPPYCGISDASFRRFLDLLNNRYPRWAPASDPGVPGRTPPAP
jgi:hypothetical protein